jgi:hypothetical protein
VTRKPVGFKAVLGAYGWLEAMCREIHKRGIESEPGWIPSRISAAASASARARRATPGASGPVVLMIEVRAE